MLRINMMFLKLNKIILNMGLGEDASDGKKLKSCIEDMSLIAGSKTYYN